jgi:hypothetical protein
MKRHFSPKHLCGLTGLSLAMLVAAPLLFDSGTDFEVSAATGGMQFGANVTIASRCEITITGNGTIAPSANLMTLGSKEAGGVAGLAKVRTNRPHNVTVETLPYWQGAPVGGDTGVTFNVTFSGIKANNKGITFAERPGSSAVVMPNGNGMGETDLTVHLQAVRTGTTYPAGAYSKIVTVRCEE